MAGPFDYVSPLASVPNPADAFMQSFKGFSAIRQADLANQQQALKLQQQQEMDTYLRDLSSNPTPEAISKASVRFPQLSEQFKRSYDMLDSQQQQGRLQSAIPVYAALQNGRPDVAAKQLRDQATAMENSGQADEAKRVRAFADMAEQHPEQAKLTSGLLLSSVMGPDKFAETFAKLGGENRANAEEGRKAELQPSVLAKSQADAQTAITGAKFAESRAVQDLRMGEEQIKKWAADTEIARMNSRIAAMNAATSRANSDIQRQELGLKLQEAISKRDDKLREKVSTAEAGATNIDNMLNTIQRIQQNPRLDSVIGAIEGRLPDLGNDQSADAIALIETLGSQAFLAQIPNIKGMGALSNAEGEKLQSALQNLSRKQSETQFRANLNEASRLLIKGRENLAKSTGVNIGKPDTPAAPGARPPLSSFQR